MEAVDQIWSKWHPDEGRIWRTVILVKQAVGSLVWRGDAWIWLVFGMAGPLATGWSAEGQSRTCFGSEVGFNGCLLFYMVGQMTTRVIHRHQPQASSMAPHFEKVEVPTFVDNPPRWGTTPLYLVLTTADAVAIPTSIPQLQKEPGDSPGGLLRCPSL